MKYIKVSDRAIYLKDKEYCSISITGSLKGMKKMYGWNKAKEVFRSGNYYFCVWGEKNKQDYNAR